METLPVEILELIVRQLTPEDLARCSAVSRLWYDIFNQDWIWEPHCDAELEEPLRTTPSVATPKFVSPEEEDSTLPPICQWKLAFLREAHLWRNWGDYNNKTVHKIKNKDLAHAHFLTNDLVAAWYSDHIVIFDVSVDTAVCKDESDNSIDIKYCHKCNVMGTDMLLIKKECSVEVYEIDFPSKVLRLKHRCNFDQPINRISSRKFVANEHLCILVNENRSILQIYDFSDGMALKQEPFPLEENENRAVKIWGIQTSLTSDFVAIGFTVYQDFANLYKKLYVYNTKQLMFVPGVEIDLSEASFYFQTALHEHWLAYVDGTSFTVYNLQTRDVLMRHKGDFSFYSVHKIYVCDGSFVFMEGSAPHRKKWLKSYSPLHKTLTVVCEDPDVRIFEVMTKKMSAVNYRDYRKLLMWKFSDEKEVRFDILSFSVIEVNRSLTKMLIRDWEQNVCVRYFW